MSDSAMDIEVDDLLADAIAKDAVPDFPRMSLLETSYACASPHGSDSVDSQLVDTIVTISPH